MKRFPTLAFAALPLFGGNVYAASESEPHRIQCKEKYVILTEAYIRQYIFKHKEPYYPDNICKAIVPYHMPPTMYAPFPLNKKLDSISTMEILSTFVRSSQVLTRDDLISVNIHLYSLYKGSLIKRNDSSVTDSDLYTMSIFLYLPRDIPITTFTTKVRRDIQEKLNLNRHVLWGWGIFVELQLHEKLRIYDKDAMYVDQMPEFSQSSIDMLQDKVDLVGFVEVIDFHDMIKAWLVIQFLFFAGKN